MSKLHPSAFIFQPFLDAPIKGSLAQFPRINDALIKPNTDPVRIKGSLAQFPRINWLPPDREREHATFLEVSSTPAKPMPTWAPRKTA